MDETRNTSIYPCAVSSATNAGRAELFTKNHPNAGSWNIQLPNSRQTTTEVTIRAVGEDPKARRGGTRITLDSATGEVIEPRDTRGGGFLLSFPF